MSQEIRKPDFLMIGAQKAGTTWLWDKLDQHPGTDLPKKKEIHYFGGVENYRKGRDWYYRHFSDCRNDRVTGDASTTYLYDRIPYWLNNGRSLVHETALPSIAQLAHDEVPDAKIIVVLRDPVARALSAYRHWMRKGELPPLAGLRKTAETHPKLRIVEYGHYYRHLSSWFEVYPRDQILVLVFETDIKGGGEKGLRQAYAFLGLDEEFAPPERSRSTHPTWSWTRSAASYYGGPFRRLISHGRMGAFLDRNDFLARVAVRESDISFLRQFYAGERESLQDLTGLDLSAWTYGRSEIANKDTN